MSQEAIGKYRIEGILGQGGMGLVYRGYDASLDRYAALKVMNESCRSQQEFRARFFQEARSAAALNHDNIITIYELNEDPELPFIAMEYVDGPSLKSIIQSEESVPFEEKLRIMAEVCQGLAHAHQKGVIHRDVKPDNIMIGPDGKAKVLDFGISRLARGADEVNLTLAGTVMGSPNYMSPEQAAGQTDQLDACSDIFSLGSVFFELLTGAPPFHSQSREAISSRIRTQPHPSLTAALPGFPEELGRIIDKALAKKRQERYQDASRMAADLNAFRARLPRCQQQLSLQVEELEAYLRRAMSQLPDEEASRYRTEPRPGDPEDLGNLLWRSRELHRRLKALWKQHPGLAQTLPSRLWAACDSTGTVLLAASPAKGGKRKRQWKWSAAAAAGIVFGAASIALWLAAQRGIEGSLPGNSNSSRIDPVVDPLPLPEEVDAQGGTMVLIPGGDFVFGSPFGQGRFDQDNGYENESPQRTLELDDFYIDKYEVTNREYLEFCRQTGRPQPDNPPWDSSYFQGKLDSPVFNVDWSTAQDFCRWAGKRLPTEAEWEKAARGRYGLTFPWGDRFEPGLANLGGGQDDQEQAAAVGTFPADSSPFGVMDMAGNVSEWVQDDYRLYPGNPASLPPEEQGRKVVRGGFYYAREDLGRFARLSYRVSFPPSESVTVIGFRCAADVEAVAGQPQ